MSKKNKYREAHPEWFDEKGRPHVWVLRELFDYNAETGDLHWKERDAKWFDDYIGGNGATIAASALARKWNKRYSGKTINSTSGSVSIFYYDTNVLSVCSALIYGFWSEGFQSDAAAIRLRKDSSSHHIGVSWDKNRKRWRAIYWNGIGKKVIGQFHTEEYAALAYNDYIDEHGKDSDYRNYIEDEQAAKENEIKAKMLAKLNSGRSSRFIGVYRAEGKKWRAQIRVNKTNINLGTFCTEREAADAYDDAARKYFGRYALQNNAPRPKPKPAPLTSEAAPTDGDDF